MIDQHRQAFLEEAQELLTELESALLELDERPTDMDLIQRTFRALHTIKGSGSMFGFDEVSRFTHQVETAFDQVREGRLAVTPELVNITLAARDRIRMMLQGAESGEAQDATESAAILERLSKLSAAPATMATTAASAIASGIQREWRIVFRPAPDIFLQGTNPLLLFRELREMGDLKVTVRSDAIPGFREMDPESCYLEWELLLDTNRSRDDIRGVFLFVEDDCKLTVEPVEGEAGDCPRPVPAMVEKAKEPWSVGSRDKRREPSSAGGDTVSIRVAIDRVDRLINYVGELVVVQARLSQLAATSDAPELRLVAEEVEHLTSELRDNAMSMRMFPLKTTFERFRRLVHDLTRDLGKEVEFSTEGGETELDKTVIDQLSDPLLHLIRNSMDHGIATPDERVAAGKSRVGKLRLSAAYSGANVLIRISDDGRGLDREAIRERAVEKGLISPDAQLSDSETYSLILLAGFSTSKQVTGISGRGVGMDVVRRSVDALRGSLEITSEPGRGTDVTLRLPLTLAIIDGLLVRVAEAHFIVPLSNVVECVELTQRDIQEAHGNHIAYVRGEIVPYIRLSEYFRMEIEQPEREQILVVETEHGRYGFAVDQVLGDHQTVIKNLGKLYRSVQVVSGATILGDGRVALILDPHRLVQNAIQAPDPTRGEGRRMGRNRGVAAQPNNRNGNADLKGKEIHVT
jgi:two-component system, chemotaxis family, sensor kinase CheA